ncbi:hypothetical protein LR48_Vigan02g026200 [Vigna angularis]|uniref:Uncharacterized protein n=1 Tax=Phaseolus angularis TaxID=3914 RepID=A0A0L9TUP9_PHAAN|nr:hypothetical protein LR48_Vigan02g026200 [Vigna angularis]
MTNERSSSSERALVQQRTNARPAANERSTTERTVVQCGTNGCPAVRGRRASVLWWTTVRSTLDDRSFAGRALVRCWTSARSLLDLRSFAARRARSSSQHSLINFF